MEGEHPHILQQTRRKGVVGINPVDGAAEKAGRMGGGEGESPEIIPDGIGKIGRLALGGKRATEHEGPGQPQTQPAQRRLQGSDFPSATVGTGVGHLQQAGRQGRIGGNQTGQLPELHVRVPALGHYLEGNPRDGGEGIAGCYLRYGLADDIGLIAAFS